MLESVFFHHSVDVRYFKTHSYFRFCPLLTVSGGHFIILFGNFVLSHMLCMAVPCYLLCVCQLLSVLTFILVCTLSLYTILTDIKCIIFHCIQFVFDQLSPSAQRKRLICINACIVLIAVSYTHL